MARLLEIITSSIGQVQIVGKILTNCKLRELDQAAKQAVCFPQLATDGYAGSACSCSPLCYLIINTFSFQIDLFASALEGLITPEHLGGLWRFQV